MNRLSLISSLVVSVFLCNLQPAHCDLISYRNAVLADNPYAFYRLGESGGVTAFDESPNARHGTYMNSPTLGVPGFGGDTAVGFDGTDDYVRAPLSEFGLQMNSFSAEAIFKTTSLQFGSIFASYNSTIPNTGFSARINSSSLGGTYQAGGTGFYVRDDNGLGISGNFTTDVYDGLWHHLVMTYDSSGATASDRLKVYLDGQEQPLSFFFTQAPSNFLTLDQPMGIGATQVTLPNAANFFDGTIDAVAFYDHVLSPGQVAAHYNAASVPEPTGALFMVVAGFGMLVLSRRK